MEGLFDMWTRTKNVSNGKDARRKKIKNSPFSLFTSSNHLKAHEVYSYEDAGAYPPQELRKLMGIS